MTKEIKESKENKQVNHVADIIGEWGNWQRSLFIYLFLLDIIGALNNMGYSFYTFQVEFWCDDVPWDYKVYMFLEVLYSLFLYHVIYDISKIIISTFISEQNRSNEVLQVHQFK